MNIVAIDPGACAGFAMGSTTAGPLVAGICPGFAHLRTAEIHALVIECPQVYPRSQARPNDLITLAVNVGEFIRHYAAAGVAVYVVRPHAWKGNVPDKIHEARVKEEALSYGLGASIWERVSKLPKSTRHNAIDALGLFLWAVRNARRLPDFKR